jgi:hypothetical protein
MRDSELSRYLDGCTKLSFRGNLTIVNRQRMRRTLPIGECSGIHPS